MLENLVRFSYPYPVAATYQSLESIVYPEEMPQKFNRIIDLYDCILKTLNYSLLGLSFHNRLLNPVLKQKLEITLKNPVFTNWTDLLATLLENLAHSKEPLVDSIRRFYYAPDPSLGRVRDAVYFMLAKPTSVGDVKEITIARFFEDFNRYVSHSDVKAGKNFTKPVEVLMPVFREILEKMDFFREYALAYIPQIQLEGFQYDHTVDVLSGLAPSRTRYLSETPIPERNRKMYMFRVTKEGLKPMFCLHPFIIAHRCAAHDKNEIYYVRYQQGDEMDYSCYQCRERFRPERLLIDFRDKMDSFIEDRKADVSDDIVRIFRELVEVAWQDGILTDEERRKLEFFRSHFNIPEHTFRNIEDNVKREMGIQVEEVDLRVVRRYENVIKNSILKGRITTKLREFIEGYRMEWNIPQDYARKLESRIWYEEGLHFLEKGNSAKAYTCFFNSHLLDDSNKLALEKVHLLSPERKFKPDILDTVQLTRHDTAGMIRHEDMLSPKEVETVSMQVKKTRLAEEPPDTIILESPKERIVKEPLVKITEPIYTPSGRSKKILKATKAARDEAQDAYYTTQDMTGEEEAYVEEYAEYEDAAQAEQQYDEGAYEEEVEYADYPEEEQEGELASGETEEVYEDEEIPREGSEPAESPEEQTDEEPVEEDQAEPVEPEDEETVEVVPEEEAEMEASPEEIEEAIEEAAEEIAPAEIRSEKEPETPEQTEETAEETATEEQASEEEIPAEEEPDEAARETADEDEEEEAEDDSESDADTIPLDSTVNRIVKHEIKPEVKPEPETEPVKPVKEEEPAQEKQTAEEPAMEEPAPAVETETAVTQDEPEKAEEEVKQAEEVVEKPVSAKERKGKKPQVEIVIKAEPVKEPEITADAGEESPLRVTAVSNGPDTGDLRESLDDIMAESERSEKKVGLLEILPTLDIPSIEEEIEKIEDEEGEKISIVDEWKDKTAAAAGIDLGGVKAADVTPSLDDFHVEVPTVDMSDEDEQEEEEEPVKPELSVKPEPVVVPEAAEEKPELESPKTTELVKRPSHPNKDTSTRKHPSGKNIAQLLADAKSNIQADNFDAARRICDQILEIDPDNLVGKLLRGKCAIEEEDYEVAYRDLSSVLSVKGEDPTLLLLHGKAALEVGDLKSALKDLRDVTEKMPGNHEGWLLRGNVLLEMGKFQNAIKDFTRSIKLNPDETEAYLNRGNAFIELREFEKGIQDYNKAIEIDNEDSYLYFQRGNAYFLMKEYDVALRDFNTAIKIDPDDNDYYVNRGITYARLSKDEPALADFNRVIESENDITMAVSRRGQLHLEMDRFGEALADFNKVIKDLPAEPEGYVLRSKTYLEMGDFKKALGDAEKALSIDPENFHALVAQGNVYLSRELYDDAIESYSRALFIEPNLAEACMNRGVANEKRGDMEAAKQDFDRYLQINRIESVAL
ncbi:MAG: tetratricopeptide repeat protein [Firmicutes bacterium]|nr:tetratricopeptide repeat protein [Bacillota bacterium]